MDNMDGIFEFLRAHYQYVLIAGGLLFLIGAIRDWQWVCSATSKGRVLRGFFFEVWGEKGYRIFAGICGLFIVICGIVLLIFDKR